MKRLIAGLLMLGTLFAASSGTAQAQTRNATIPWTRDAKAVNAHNAAIRNVGAYPYGTAPNPYNPAGYPYGAAPPAAYPNPYNGAYPYGTAAPYQYNPGAHPYNSSPYPYNTHPHKTGAYPYNTGTWQPRAQTPQDDYLRKFYLP